MKIPARPDPELLHAQTFALRAWVLAAASVLAGRVWRHLPRSWRIEARLFVRYAASDLKYLVVQLAVAHWRLHGFHKRRTRPQTAPPGFRGGRHKASVRRKFKRVVRLLSHADARYGALSPVIARYGVSSRVDACLRDVRNDVARRIASMRWVLQNLRFWIARLHRRFATIKTGARLVAVRPAAVVVRACFAPSPICADTS